MSSTMGRAALVVSGGILASRLLGFLREVVLAALLGRTIEADLYQAAFAIPDYLFFLMAGGYLAITFVPIISRHLAARDQDGANRAFTAVTRVVGGLMLVVTVVTLVAAEALTRRLFPEFPSDRLPELVHLVSIVLPAQFFFVLGSLLMAVQYAHRRFVIPTLAPVIYNVAIIAGGLIGEATGNPGPAGFIWGALVGAVVGNFALQWWGASRLGTRLQPGVPLLHESVPEYFALAFPLMIGQSAVALDEVFMRVFGQLGDIGDTAALGYARRINLLPIGVIAQAAGVASYPFLANLFAEGKLAEMRQTVSRAIRASLLVSGLATAGVAGLAGPIVQIAFQRGEFDPGDTVVTSVLLAIYGLSIPMWAAHQVYTRGFYAQRRMWLPVGIGTAITVIAIPGYIVGSSRLGAAGVAWASVGVMGLYALAVAWWWHRENPDREVAVTLGRTILATVPAALGGWLVNRWLTGGEPTSTGVALAALVGGGALAVGVYWLVLRALGAPELRLLRR